MVNIVLVGSGFPVAKVEVADIVVPAGPWEEQTRIPVMLDATAGEYRMLLGPNRAEFSIVSVPPSIERVGAVVEAAQRFVDLYAGQKSVLAIGHNIRVLLGPQDMQAEVFLQNFFPGDLLASSLGVVGLGAAELVWSFKQGEEDQANLKASVTSADRVRIDLNYHFTVKTDAPAEGTIRKLPATLIASQQVVERLSQFKPADRGV